MSTLMVGNIVATIAAMFMLYAGVLKEKKKILFIQTIQIALLVASNFILGGIIGGILNILCIIRNLLSYNDKLGLNINNTICKPTFGSVALMNIIKELHNSRTYDLKENTDISTKIDTIEFCGFCTDICVISNVLMIKALLPEVNIIVNSKLCAGVTPESHEAALTTMRMCQVNVK